jgi:hypothetical protein
MEDNKNDNETLKLKFKEKMINEFTKFLNAYNEVANTNYILDIRGEYDVFIRFLGNYIYKEFNIDSWNNTTIKFSEEVIINLFLFNNTKYYEPVKKFLLLLKDAFFNSLDDDIYDYLENTKDYTKDEKKICLEFYDRVSSLNKAMKHSTFDSKNTQILSNENISSYSHQLKEFNNYSHYISSNPQLYNLISHFDKKIRLLSQNKKYPEILFDV